MRARTSEPSVTERRARDPDLLDALDASERITFEGDVWRIVRQERPPLQGSPTKARWDPGTFDVLYTSLSKQGALEEIYFHLTRQPVFPSKIRSVLYRISVKTRRTLEFLDLEALAAVGVSSEKYGDLDYQRTQEIGDAAYFLGFDGLMVPSARSSCQNLVIFSDQFAPDELQVVEQEQVDWNAWRKEGKLGGNR